MADKNIPPLKHAPPDWQRIGLHEGIGADSIEAHYAGLSDQHLKNLAAGLEDALLEKAMPESARIVHELIKRIGKKG